MDALIGLVVQLLGLLFWSVFGVGVLGALLTLYAAGVGWPPLVVALLGLGTLAAWGWSVRGWWRAWRAG
ncbi:hypothetical protein GO986_02845 [Deinococcus sp. HMF7620]|uniref:Uncharacterized protein n=1 Tax=Deinococcus arboris TaxID=2682977 RepID=A0A7C9LKB9_9DEIO|nr:hypothetical protein [Deinococcus arboris]MVN85697.1 hypothetical protein [Deinococcus arboris]